MRKEAGYEVTDRIAVTYEAGEKLAAIIERGAKDICGACLLYTSFPRPLP